ncbi:MAG: YfhO family protein, partial [Bacilli bacterium]|nr:YfhO family protein [Bacilli bacterium]
MNKILKNKALVAFLSSLLLGTIITLPNIIGGHGTFTLIADWNFQQIPFNKLINDSIKEGSYLWTWFNELGSNFIGTFSFYNLFSPFNIIAYIFPSSWFEYLIGPIFILKYAVAGLTSYLFIQRYVKNKNYALIGSLLYAFSGFQLTNTLFYHFHDVVAIFPLLLYTLDSLVLDNKKGKFALVVALCALTNWFFFIGEVVFVILYFIVRVITKSYKINFNKFIQIVLESLIGTLLSAFVLLPSLLFVSSNPRINNSWDIIKMFKYENMVNYAEIIRSFIFAPEIMYIRSIFSENNYTSVELYLPFVGCILFISYILKNIRKCQSIMSIISVVFMLIPILNSSFFAFTTTYYARWFYMPILIFSLISSICLDKNYKIENGVLLSIFA